MLSEVLFKIILIQNDFNISMKEIRQNNWYCCVTLV